MLIHFSRRYCQCNPEESTSEGTAAFPLPPCHTTGHLCTGLECKTSQARLRLLPFPGILPWSLSLPWEGLGVLVLTDPPNRATAGSRCQLTALRCKHILAHGLVLEGPHKRAGEHQGGGRDWNITFTSSSFGFRSGKFGLLKKNCFEANLMVVVLGRGKV